MPLAMPISQHLLEDRLKRSSSAEEALRALVLAGCHRGTLLRLLGGGMPSLRSWTQFNRRLVPAPKQLRARAEKLERASKEIVAVTEFMGHLSFGQLRRRALIVAREVRYLAMSLRIVAGSSVLRTTRSWLSYRNMGKTFQIASLCHYVKTRTKKSHFREIADLLSTTTQRVVAEDALRHQVERATKKLECDERFAPMLSAFVNFFENFETRLSGHERGSKISR